MWSIHEVSHTQFLPKTKLYSNALYSDPFTLLRSIHEVSHMQFTKQPKTKICRNHLVPSYHNSYQNHSYNTYTKCRVCKLIKTYSPSIPLEYLHHIPHFFCTTYILYAILQLHFSSFISYNAFSADVTVFSSLRSGAPSGHFSDRSSAMWHADHDFLYQ